MDGVLANRFHEGAQRLAVGMGQPAAGLRDGIGFKLEPHGKDFPQAGRRQIRDEAGRVRLLCDQALMLEDLKSLADACLAGAGGFGDGALDEALAGS